MTVTEYVDWVKHSIAGDRLTYHVGHLAHERGRYGPKMEWLPTPLDALANLIYGDWGRGLVELTQRQKTGVGIRTYEYYATRTTKEL